MEQEFVAHESPTHESRKSSIQIFPLGSFSILDPAAHDGASGYDYRSHIAVSLAKADPSDSQVKNAPLRHQVDNKACM